MVLFKESFKIKDNKLIVNCSEKEKKIIIGIFLFVLSIMAFWVVNNIIWDTDAFWHIKTGEWIIENKTIPKNDIFSWYGIQEGLSWTNHEWLFEVIISICYKISGLKGVVTFVNIIAVAIFLSLYYLCKIKSKNTPISIFIASIGIIFTQQSFAARPQIISFLCFIIVAILLEKKHYMKSLLTIIIAINFHGGVYPIYIILVIYYCYKTKPIMILYTLIAININPNGFELFMYTFRNRMSDLGSKYILEAQATKMVEGYNFFILIMYIALIILLHNVKIKSDDMILVLAFVGLTFIAERHTVFAYFIVLPHLSKYIKQGIDNWMCLINSHFKKNIFDSDLIIGVLLGISCMLMLQFSIVGYSRTYQKQLVSSTNFPVEAVQYLKENPLENLYHSYNYGGYLILNDIPTFVDGRADPFSEYFNNTTVLRDFFQSNILETDIEEFFNKYQIKNILLNKNSTLNKFVKYTQSNAYTIIYEDDNFIIYKRSTRVEL